MKTLGKCISLLGLIFAGALHPATPTKTAELRTLMSKVIDLNSIKVQVIVPPKSESSSSASVDPVPRSTDIIDVNDPIIDIQGATEDTQNAFLDYITKNPARQEHLLSMGRKMGKNPDALKTLLIDHFEQILLKIGAKDTSNSEELRTIKKKFLEVLNTPQAIFIFRRDCEKNNLNNITNLLTGLIANMPPLNAEGMNGDMRNEKFYKQTLIRAFEVFNKADLLPPMEYIHFKEALSTQLIDENSLSSVIVQSFKGCDREECNYFFGSTFYSTLISVIVEYHKKQNKLIAQNEHLGRAIAAARRKTKGIFPFARLGRIQHGYLIIFFQ